MGASMRHFLSICVVTSLLIPVAAAADCVTDQYGKVVCGRGDCEKDDHGKVYCADFGGGAIRNNYGKVLCGVGYCAKDDMGKAWCSTVQGGDAAIGSNGKVKCLEGCEAASNDKCQEAQ